MIRLRSATSETFLAVSFDVRSSDGVFPPPRNPRAIHRSSWRCSLSRLTLSLSIILISASAYPLAERQHGEIDRLVESKPRSSIFESGHARTRPRDSLYIWQTPSVASRERRPRASLRALLNSPSQQYFFTASIASAVEVERAIVLGFFRARRLS